jgi:hypothetical protein
MAPFWEFERAASRALRSGRPLPGFTRPEQGPVRMRNLALGGALDASSTTGTRRLCGALEHTAVRDFAGFLRTAIAFGGASCEVHEQLVVPVRGNQGEPLGRDRGRARPGGRGTWVGSRRLEFRRSVEPVAARTHPPRQPHSTRGHEPRSSVGHASPRRSALFASIRVHRRAQPAVRERGPGHAAAAAGPAAVGCRAAGGLPAMAVCANRWSARSK